MLLDYILPWVTGKNLELVAAASICALWIVALVKPDLLPQKANKLLSRIIHLYLCCRYPIKTVDGSQDLPTAPYVWPNGQGDIGKFLDGVENSGLWETSHGKIYRIWSGMNPEVVLTRPEHLQAVFGDSDKHIKADANNSGYLMSRLLGQCVGLISGERWRTLRAVTETAFLHHNVDAYLPRITQHVETFFAGLEQHGNLRSGLLHPAQDLKLLPFWIVAEVFYGELSAEQVAALNALIPLREELFNKYIIRGGLSRFSWMRFFPTEGHRALADFKTRWEAFNCAAYERARTRASGEGSVSAPPIVAMFEAVDDGTITREQLLQTLDEALFANLDVTIGGVSWNPVFLAVNTDAQDRLRDEVLSLSSSREDSQKDIRRYALSSSSFLAACVSESARLKPLAAFSVPQAAPTDRIVGGYVVPAGTNFVVDSYALNVRNEYWGANATAYEPERFLRMSATRARYQFWRFGFGPRQCMGKYMADLIIRALLMHLVRNYRLGMPVGAAKGTEEWARSSESWITHPDLLVKCEKLDGDRANGSLKS